MSENDSPKPRQAERGVEEHLRRLAESGELRGLPGEGAPLADADDSGPPETWAARHLLRNANAAPEWADLRKEIDARTDQLRRRVHAHREWLHDRTRYLAEIPAERVIEASRATAERDGRVRAEIADALSELNALVRRYDLQVVPAMQLPLITPERLGLD